MVAEANLAYFRPGYAYDGGRAVLERIDLANINFGQDDAGNPTAVVTFKVTDGNPIPSALDFEIDVLVRSDGDVAGVVSVAKRAFHALAAALAEKSEAWAR